MQGLIVTTKECNLRCKYCFECTMHKEKHFSTQKINYEFKKAMPLFKKFVDKIVEYNDNKCLESSIIFHGGEPLLINLKYYEELFNYISNKKNTSIGIQTNGTLIDDAAINLFKKYHVRVGVSIDGSKDMHDLYRVNFNNQGTFEIVFSAIKKMKSEGIVVGGMATVTNVVASNPDRFYDFFSRNNIGFNFNPCFDFSKNNNVYEPLSHKKYINFINRLFDLWINDQKTKIQITPFRRILSAMCVQNEVHLSVCTYGIDCSNSIIAMDTNGDYYRCLHWCGNHNNVLGNVCNDEINDLINKDHFLERWEFLKRHDCKDCSIRDYCYGGCPYMALDNNNDLYSKDFSCDIQKETIKHIYGKLLKYKNV